MNQPDSEVEKKTKMAEEKPPAFLSEMAIKCYKNTYVKISTISAILIFIGGGAWWLANQSIELTKAKAESINETLKITEKKYTKLTEKYTILNEDFSKLKQLEKVPTLLNPISRKQITGRFITFRWKYDVNPGFQSFILELIHYPLNGMVREGRYQIPRPDKNSMHLELPPGTNGEFYWRIGTGELLATKYPKKKKSEKVINSEITIGNFFFGDQKLIFKLEPEKETRKDAKEENVKKKSTVAKDKNELRPESYPADSRLWSRYGNFSVHASTLNRVISREKLVVGTTAAFLHYDHTIDCYGRPDTYDMDFIEWIADRMHNYPEVEPKIIVERKIFTWDEIFDKLAAGEADVAIANITKSKHREEKYRGLRFTKGYRENYQRIVFSRSLLSELVGKKPKLRELKILFRDKTIGSQNKSINQKSAEYLQKNYFSYKHKSSFDTYVDVLQAVRVGEIDFGIIDSVRMDTVSYPELAQIDFDFNSLLKGMYRDKLGYTKEDNYTENYAIAVHSSGTSNDLLNLLDKIIDSEDGKEKRKELEEIHLADNHSKNEIKDFGCKRINQ